jgi:hypothetical protein
MFAQGRYSDGSTQDFTNLAVWQTSDPGIATVSNVGMVTAATEGRARILATYRAVTGALDINIAKPGCRYTLNPPVLVFGAFGGTAEIQVTASLSDCRWRVRSESDWFRYSFDPNRSGNGVFRYDVPPNSTPRSREASFIVVDSGTSAEVRHQMTQERPVSCSYVTNPRETRFPISGGSASFSVVTDPPDCRWNVEAFVFTSEIFRGTVSPTSGQGAARITITAPSRNVSSYADIEIRGLSGQNPPGIHRVIWGNPSFPPYAK